MSASITEPIHKVPLPFDDLTEMQTKIVAITIRISAMLSILGSVIVLRRILDPETRATKLKTLYHRIVLFICVNDILGSTAMFMGTWPIPKDNVHSNFIWGNIGDQMTCNVQGYFVQSAVVSVAICTVFLSIYFLLFVRYNWSEKRLKKIERLMQFCVTIEYVSSLIPLFDESYNTTPIFCWIQSYPLNCDVDVTVECLRGDNANIYRILLMVIPISICIVIIIVAMTMLYASVREQEMKISQYTSRRALDTLSKRSRNVFIQAMMFVGSFSTIWLPGVAMVILSKQSQGNGSFWFLLLVSVCLPLQGAFNAIIYTRFRPDVKSLLKKFSDYLRRRTVVIFRGDSSSHGHSNSEITGVDTGDKTDQHRIASNDPPFVGRYGQAHNAVHLLHIDLENLFAFSENDDVSSHEITCCVDTDGVMTMKGQVALSYRHERAQTAVAFLDSKSEDIDDTDDILVDDKSHDISSRGDQNYDAHGKSITPPLHSRLSVPSRYEKATQLFESESESEKQNETYENSEESGVDEILVCPQSDVIHPDKSIEHSLVNEDKG